MIVETYLEVVNSGTRSGGQIHLPLEKMRLGVVVLAPFLRRVPGTITRSIFMYMYVFITYYTWQCPSSYTG